VGSSAVARLSAATLRLNRLWDGGDAGGKGAAEACRVSGWPSLGVAFGFRVVSPRRKPPLPGGFDALLGSGAIVEVCVVASQTASEAAGSDTCANQGSGFRWVGVSC